MAARETILARVVFVVIVDDGSHGSPRESTAGQSCGYYSTPLNPSFLVA